MPGFVSGIGQACLAGVRNVGGYSLLFAHVLRSLLGGWPRRRVLVNQFYQIGNRSVPVVLTTGLFTGMVIAIQTYYQFRRVQLETMVGAVIAVSMVKELGPVLTALMLAGRVGAAMSAELGTMTVTEQVDALRAMSVDPIRFLVLPRFVACVLLAPILTVLSDTIGIIGGYLVGVEALGIDRFFYIEMTLQWLELWDIMGGLIKASCFGAIICVVCCYNGLTARAGAEGVGRATTCSVVTSCIMILIADFFLTVLMF